MNAVISAAVSYSLTKACSQGSLPNCDCGKVNQGEELLLFFSLCLCMIILFRGKVNQGGEEISR